MPEVVVSIGSNIEPVKHVRLALRELRRRFESLRCSPFYESRAVGFDGANFINLVASFETDLALASVTDAISELEQLAGRDRIQGRRGEFASRTLDVDILLYGENSGDVDGVELPRAEIMQHAHVLRPLSELFPQRRHPVNGKTYRQLWDEFDRPDQALWQITLEDE